MPLLVAGLQQQGQRENRILNKTEERIIMRKKLKKEGQPELVKEIGCSKSTISRFISGAKGTLTTNRC